MFKLFKGKSKLDKLNAKYRALLKEAYDLSTSNRAASDAKTAEANALLEEIEKLKQEEA